MSVSANASRNKTVAAICYPSLAAALIIMLLQISVARASPKVSETTGDIQCLIVGARLSESPNPDVKLSGGMMMTYFLGRIDGRTPRANIETLIVREIGAMTYEDYEQASRRCHAEFSARGVEFTKIGKALALTGR